MEKNLSCNLNLYDAGHCFPSGHTQSAKLFWSEVVERMMTKLANLVSVPLAKQEEAFVHQVALGST